MADSSPPSRLGRLLYGATLMYMAVDGFQSNEKRVEIAREKGVPVPDLLVPFVTGMLFVANLGIVCWKFPRASAGAVIVFFLGTTPGIHDFWTMEGEERQANKINFCKNVALLGGAVLLLEAANDDSVATNE
ncbi:DoxX family protein [Natronococcus roseus]|uniref:DoxX family protein n=1 Tax=Natronococcus roseus TaxID=1052014 RepID=UPI00374DC759